MLLSVPKNIESTATTPPSRYSPSHSHYQLGAVAPCTHMHAPCWPILLFLFFILFLFFCKICFQDFFPNNILLKEIFFKFFLKYFLNNFQIFLVKFFVNIARKVQETCIEHAFTKACLQRAWNVQKACIKCAWSMQRACAEHAQSVHRVCMAPSWLWSWDEVKTWQSRNRSSSRTWTKFLSPSYITICYQQINPPVLYQPSPHHTRPE